MTSFVLQKFCFSFMNFLWHKFKIYKHSLRLSITFIFTNQHILILFPNLAMKYSFFYTTAFISSFLLAATAAEDADFSIQNKFEPNRSKRSVMNTDTRFKLDMATYGNTFPFSSAVYFSHGCSGTLLTPTHVLTSASCFHNGRNFVRVSFGLWG